MNEDQLREIAERHAREAVCPIGSHEHERLQAANGFPGPEVILQNIRRQEEIIFYALKEAYQPHKSGGDYPEKLPCTVICEGPTPTSGKGVYHKGVSTALLLGYLSRRVEYNRLDGAPEPAWECLVETARQLGRASEADLPGSEKAYLALLGLIREWNPNFIIDAAPHEPCGLIQPHKPGGDFVRTCPPGKCMVPEGQPCTCIEPPSAGGENGL